MAPKNGHFLRIKAAAVLEKCLCQNFFNFIKSTMDGLDNGPKTIGYSSFIGCVSYSPRIAANRSGLKGFVNKLFKNCVKMSNFFIIGF